MPTDTTLTSAIEQAVETTKLPQDLSSLPTEEKEREETQGSEEKGGEETQGGAQESDLVDSEELEQGRTLIQALKDPSKAPHVIDFLATQAGYTKANIQTRQDVREAKNEITDILAKHLGDDFKFLSDKLAPAIQESLEKLLSERSVSETSDIRARLERQELKEIQNETASTHRSLAQEWFGEDTMPDNVVKAMSAAIEEFTPTDPNISPDRYYRKIFSLVAGELGLSKNGKATKSDRVLRNRSDEVARNLSSQNRGITPNVDGSNPRKLTLKDAVSLAVEQVNQASRK